MIEPVEKWNRFVKADAILTLLAAALLWGIYLYWLEALYDFLLLGAMILFLIDFCGLAELSITAIVLMIGWKKRKSFVTLAGLILQILYGVPYSWLFSSNCRDGFLTPGMVAGVPMLVLGFAGIFLYFTTPKEDIC